MSSMTGQPWWYHLAVLGKSVGVGIGAGAGTAALISGFIPVYGPIIATAIGGLASVASVVTHYAETGVDAGAPRATLVVPGEENQQ
jgi:hypothetical protein